jgi:hypothetical protein
MSRGMKRVFVLHDFDAYGFSIFGTLGTDSRRYRFANPPNVVDIGLRLDDVEAMGLTAEPYSPAHWGTRKRTLERHGATEEEIEFLEDRRVELNMMPSDVFIRFLEDKLVEHGAAKIVPDADVLEAHARQVIERALINKALAEVRERAYAAAASIQLPDNLPDLVADALADDPARPWDLVVADLAVAAVGDEQDDDDEEEDSDE